MPLPVPPLPTDTVEIGGEKVAIRSLSRDAVLKLSGFTDDTAGAEVFLLVNGTGVSDEEARAWRTQVAPDVAGALLVAIASLSGIRSRAKDGESDLGEA
jgi:hypothetical protein